MKLKKSDRIGKKWREKRWKNFKRLKEMKRSKKNRKETKKKSIEISEKKLKEILK